MLVYREAPGSDIKISLGTQLLSEYSHCVYLINDEHSVPSDHYDQIRNISRQIEKLNGAQISIAIKSMETKAGLAYH